MRGLYHRSDASSLLCHAFLYGMAGIPENGEADRNNVTSDRSLTASKRIDDQLNHELFTATFKENHV
jgi:transcriptional regulator of met regulon